ncbi:MAG: tyrosine-type recombinase/integrase [Patescibacteria group bacterium]
MPRRGRGEGSVGRLKSGLWYAQASFGFDANGKRIRRRVYGRTKTEALEKLRTVQGDALKGAPVQVGRITVEHHFRDWLRAKKAEVRPSTLSSYTETYERYIRPYFGGLQLAAVDYRRINALFAELDEAGLSPRTVALAALVLRAAFDDALAKGLIARNPARLAAKRTYSHKEARFLVPDELRRFLDAARGARLEDLFLLGLDSGMRSGELRGLAWSAIDWEGSKATVRQAIIEDSATGQISISPVKTGAGRRTITLSPMGMAALARQKERQDAEKQAAIERRERRTAMRRHVPDWPPWRNEWDLVFTDEDGGPLRKRNVLRRDLAAVTSAAGLEGVSLHTLRHTHAAILIAQGVDPKTLQYRMGHASIHVTLGVYGHLFPGRDEAAAAGMGAFMDTLWNGYTKDTVGADGQKESPAGIQS